MFCEDSSGFRAKPATRFGTTSKNGRFTPEYPAGFSRNGWQVYTGIGGRVRTEFSLTVLFDYVIDFTEVFVI